MLTQEPPNLVVRCPACDAPLPPAARDCLGCGHVQARRLAVLLGELHRASTAVVRAQAEADAYLGEIRATLPQHRPARRMPVGPPPTWQPQPMPQQPQQPLPQQPQQPQPMPARPQPPAPVPAQQQPRPAQQTPAPVVEQPVGQRVTADTESEQLSPATKRIRRLTPQTTLLSLGVLLVFAAAITFLAVVWNRLGVPVQTGIMALIGIGFLAAAVPASKRRLAGTAEAFSVLGMGVVAAVLVTLRVRGVLAGGDTTVYAALSCLALAVMMLALHRYVPGLRTVGVVAILLTQVPLTLMLARVVDGPELMLAIGVQAFVTAWLSRRVEQAHLRLLATVLAWLGYVVALLGSLLLAANELMTGSHGLLGAGVAVVLGLAGVAAIEVRWPATESAPRPGTQVVCAVAAAVATGLAAETLNSWLVTALAVVVLTVELAWWRRLELLGAGAVLGVMALVAPLASENVVQLAAIALLTGALAMLARARRRLAAAVASTIALPMPIVAVLLLSAGGPASDKLAALTYAVYAAAMVALAGVRLGKPDEQPALWSAGAAIVAGAGQTLLTGSLTGTGVVLLIGSAPLLAYGRLPRRWPALPFAVVLLTVANSLLEASANAGTVELYTVPPALLLLVAGRFGPRPKTSWIDLGPGLLLGLLPSSVLAITTGDPVRVAVVIAVALAYVVIGTTRSLQAPFVIGTGVLTKLGIWQLVALTPQFPRWLPLAIAGAVLLTLGATYEKRLADAKRTAKWIAKLR